MTTPAPTPAPERISPAEIRAWFQLLHERMDTIDSDLQELRAALAQAAARPQTAAATEGETVTFDASILLIGTDDNGDPTYKIKGGQYMKFGVRVWPEVLPLLEIDVSKLKPGPNPFNLKVRALMGKLGPRKIIGPA
jgi:hypothetical protein